MNILVIVLIVVIAIAALGSAPSWPYSTGWGYYPSGGLGLLLVVLVVLLLMGKL